jgi:hypothetical protein
MAAVPIFRVSETLREPFRLLGTLSTTKFRADTWVKDDWVTDLRVGNIVLSGFWRRSTSDWIFTPTAEDAARRLGDHRDFQVFDGYWGERVSIVLDESLSWQRAEIADVSDHSHCGICWATISSDENSSHYAAEGRVLCESCHDAHIRRRSLDFTSLGGPAV